MQLRPFTLSKWYMDCVTDEGDAAIVYSAKIDWRGVHLHLCSVLSGTGGNFRTHTSISPYRVDAVDGHIAADLGKLGVIGTWESDSLPFERVVYEQEEGNVRWNCLQPRSIARVHLGDHTLRGLGYAESLTLSIMPWKLPLKHLPWGRFVSPQDSLAWVDWQGNRRMAAISSLQHAQCGAEFRTDDGVEVDYPSMARAFAGGRRFRGRLVALRAGGRPRGGLRARRAFARACARFSGPDERGGLGAYGDWNVGAWCERVQREKHEIGM